MGGRWSVLTLCAGTRGIGGQRRAIPRCAATASLRCGHDRGGLDRRLGERSDTLLRRARRPPAGPALVLLPGPTDSSSSYRSALERIPRCRSGWLRCRSEGTVTPTSLPSATRSRTSCVMLCRCWTPSGSSGPSSPVTAAPVWSPAASRSTTPNALEGSVLEASPTTLVRNERLQAFVDSVVSDLRGPDRRQLRPLVRGRHLLGGCRARIAGRADARPPEGPSACVAGDVRGPAQLRRHPEARTHRCPSRADLGDADELVSREMQERLAGRLSRSELLIYAGVGHTPRREDPTRFAGDVTAFVEALA